MNQTDLTLALLFSITENFGMNLEYSYTDLDSDDANEFYLEGFTDLLIFALI